MKVVPLRHAAEVVLGRQRAPEYEQGDGQTRYLRSANIRDGRVDLSDVKSMRFSQVECARFGLEPGDVLVTEGSGSRDTVGASAVWMGELDGPVCFQNTLLRLRPRAGISGRYLAWWARHAHASKLVATVATGANILHVGAEAMGALAVALPPLDQQRRIADFLDDQVALLDQAAIASAGFARLADARFATWLGELLDTEPAAVPVKALTGTITSGPRGWGDLVAPGGTVFLRIANLPKGGVEIVVTFSALRFREVPRGSARGPAPATCSCPSLRASAMLASCVMTGPGTQM